MALTPLGLLAAFGAGALSFVSPCVLPLVPGYLSYLAGTGIHELDRTGTARGRVGLHALCFVLGFALLFTLLGAAAALLGSALQDYQRLLARLAGLLLLLFGIALTGLVPIPFLSSNMRVQVGRGATAWWRSALVGMAFGASWSACSGPILGAILVLTAVSATLTQGISYLLVYALGLGVPFLLTGILAERVVALFRPARRYMRLISFIVGVVLILMGMLAMTGRLDEVSSVFPTWFASG
jgi:cytochrome c-type biogenesis protein